ncbi:MAG TPA: hypothetical protein VJL58_10250 [Pyrinomonadaceae bacterium]|nr:hypothetical protein [Pyrinomonadaceae bacterium]
MSKTTSINLRISPEFRDEIEQLAAFHGLSMSSYVHSLLVKAVRRERESTPEAFPKQKAPIVASIGPGEMSKADIRRQYIDEQGKPLAPKSGKQIPMLQGKGQRRKAK